MEAKKIPFLFDIYWTHKNQSCTIKKMFVVLTRIIIACTLQSCIVNHAHPPSKTSPRLSRAGGVPVKICSIPIAHIYLLGS